MAKLHNFVGAATLDELSTTAEESVTEEIASDEPGVTTAEKPSTAEEDVGAEPCDGATDEESSPQPNTRTQPVIEMAHAKFLTHFFIGVFPFLQNNYN
jgi:hypothetical protein